MDPLTAVGLAGNILNFVDFSAKVLSRAKHLYESASGATAENDELESLTTNLKSLAEKVQRRPSQVPRKGHFHINITSESFLDNLSQQCIQVADELLETLDSIKVKGDGRTRKSAVQAMKTIWRQDHIDALQKRLDRVSKQLTEGLSMGYLEEINRRLREMAVENTHLEANRSAEIDKLRRDFNSAIEEIKFGNEGEKVPDAWLILSDTARRGQTYFAEQVILESLRFSSIESRLESVSEEHAKTFSWIFKEDSSTRFVQWLRGDDDVYWVSGKPGSGKSTLMKFVAAHETTQRFLKEWAGDKKLVIANFFFWSASKHRSQKSQKGLLRTILYQILRQCPELIQMAYQDQWIAMTSDGRVLKETRDELLTVPALLKTLKKISISTASDTKFCFFLDGLDEYDGRPADIIELVDILKSFHNVKTCVSSRSWNEFEDHFGKNFPWKLYIHEFTRDDIRLYVQDTLSKSPRFQQLREEDPQCPNFVHNIVDHADGVFLWVFLVVRSLLDGLTNSDRIKDLQERVNETPKDLEDYFKTILFSTENRYRKQTARTFTIAVNTVKELPLMAYWVFDQENPNYVFECSTVTPSVTVLNSRLDNMGRRLNTLSKGLLDTRGGWSEDDSAGILLFGYTVDFLHRTVKDYLQTPDAQSLLQTWLDDTFDSDWEICSTLGALAKIASRKLFVSGIPLRDYPSTFLSHAKKLDWNPSMRTDLSCLLEHLQATLGPAFEEYRDPVYEDTEDNALILKGKVLEPDIAILSACACFGIMNFIRGKFTNEPLLAKRVTNHVYTRYWSLLLGLGYPFISIPGGTIDLAMMKLLLDHGADPNSGPNGFLEWQLILSLWEEEGDEFVKDPNAFEAIKLLLQYGADLEQTSDYDRVDATEGRRTAKDLLKEWYNADQIAVLEDIVKRRESKNKIKKHEKLSKKMRGLKLWISSKR